MMLYVPCATSPSIMCTLTIGIFGMRWWTQSQRSPLSWIWLFRHPRPLRADRYFTSRHLGLDVRYAGLCPGLPRFRWTVLRRQLYGPQGQVDSRLWQGVQGRGLGRFCWSGYGGPRLHYRGSQRSTTRRPCWRMFGVWQSGWSGKGIPRRHYRGNLHSTTGWLCRRTSAGTVRRSRVTRAPWWSGGRSSCWAEAPEAKADFARLCFIQLSLALPEDQRKGRGFPVALPDTLAPKANAGFPLCRRAGGSLCRGNQTGSRMVPHCSWLCKELFQSFHLWDGAVDQLGTCYKFRPKQTHLLQGDAVYHHSH